MLYTAISQAYLEYLRHLGNGGKPFSIEEKPHNRASDAELMVYASALGACPLQRARERNRVPMTNPPTPAEELSKLHLMRQGVMDALPVQEAMMWKFGQMHRLRTEDGKILVPSWQENGAAAEISLRSSKHRLRGRMDMLLHLDGQFHIVEVKRRDGMGGRGEPQPKLTDCLQVLAYHMMTGIASLNILLLNRYFIKLYTLQPTEGGFVLYDEAGEKWDSPHNTPEWLNIQRVQQEVERHLEYLSGEKAETPFPDFLNDARGESWFCWKWDGEKAYKYKSVYKGKVERHGTVTPRCAHWCHCALPSSGKLSFNVRETAYQSGVYELVTDQTEEEGNRDEGREQAS